MAEEKYSYILQLLADTQGGKDFKAAMFDVVAAAKQAGINLSKDFKVVDATISTTTQGFNKLTLNILDSGRRIDLAITGIIQDVRNLQRVLLEVNRLGGINANFSGLGKIGNISPEALQFMKFIQRNGGVTNLSQFPIVPTLPALPYKQPLSLPYYGQDPNAIRVPPGGFNYQSQKLLPYYGKDPNTIYIPPGGFKKSQNPFFGFEDVDPLPKTGNKKSFFGTDSDMFASWTRNAREASKGGREVTRSLKDMGSEAAKSEINFAKLALRAAAVVPVWQAVRAVFMATIGTMQDTARSIVDLDTALRNAENEIKGLQGLPVFLDKIKSSANDLALETGVGPGSIVESFRQFATAGIEAEASLSGMNTAVRGAIATNGDLNQTSRVLADVYNLMDDRITEVSSTQDKFNFIMSTMAALMPTNVFTMDEFTESLRNFLGTAKGANLTLDETFTLIAATSTAMQRGARGGTQLASAFNQMSTKIREVSQYLGKSTAGMRDFEIFVEFLKKASSEIKQTGNISGEVVDIFGNRGGRSVKALASDIDHLLTELERLQNLTFDDRQTQLLDRYDTALKKLETSFQKLKQAREELGRAFIENLFGDAEGISAKIDSLAKSVSGMKTEFIGLAEAIKNTITLLDKLASMTGIKQVTKGILEGVQGDELLKRPDSLSEAFVQLGKAISPANIFRAIGLQKEIADTKQAAAEMERYIEFMKEVNAEREKANAEPFDPQFEGVVDDAKELLKTEETINLKLEDKVKIFDSLKTLGLNDLEIAKAKLDYLRKNIDLEREKELLYQAELEYILRIQEEVIKTSEILRNSVQGALEDIFNNGFGNTTSAYKKIGETIKKEINSALAENITNQFFKSSGIGQIFGQFVGGIRNGANKGIISGFEVGSELTRKAILGSFDIATKELYNVLKGGQPGTGGNSLASLANQAQGLGGGQGGFFGGLGDKIGKFLGSSIPGTKGQGAMTLPDGRVADAAGNPLSQSGFGSANGVSIGQGIGAALGAYNLSQLYKAKGSGDVFGSAFSGATSGAQVGSLFGPIGAAIGATLGGVYGAIRGGQSKTTSAIEEQTKQVSNKIEVTNKQLEVVNRNLVALRQQITYILPESAYFSESRNLADQFSINARRGLA